MRVCAALHKTKEGVVVGVCDSELIGKVFSEGDLVLDLDLYKNFYGSETDKSKVISFFEEAITINLVGDNAVALALESKVINKTDIKKAKVIGGVRHLQVFKV